MFQNAAIFAGKYDDRLREHELGLILLSNDLPRKDIRGKEMLLSDSI